MKPVAYISILAVIIIAFSFFTMSSMRKTAERVDSQIQNMEDELHKGNWDEASVILKDVTAQWEKSRKNWAAFIDHMEIDNIDMSLARVEEYVDTKNYSPLLAEVSVLRMYVKHIPTKEELNFSNIF